MNVQASHIKAGTKLLASAIILGASLSATSYAQTAAPPTFSLAPSQPSRAGQTVTFYGAITNPGASSGGSAVYITGGTVYGLPAGLTGDISTSDLFNDTYFQMQPGDTYSPTFTKSFFTVAIASGVAPGNYTGFFDLDGGATASTTNALGTQQFTVTVAAPEPAQSAALGLGILGLGGLALRARMRRYTA